MAADATLPPGAPPDSRRFAVALVLTILLLGSFLLHLHHLGHEGIKPLDEAFHAVVAKHLIAHPLTPTLFDRPWLAYDYRDWQSNHIWLHKPIVPLWTMAASMALFGVSTLSMRLPSAILATLAVWLTYLIAKALLDDWRAGLIAAALQAINPPITSLVQGYLFSDHVDVAFLFWVELAVYLLVCAIRNGAIGWTILAGIAQGLAYLSKSYPAFIVTGIALAAWLAPVIGLATPLVGRAARNESRRVRFRGRHVLILLAATILTALPWTIWCLVYFRREFLYEQVFVFRHLTQNVEHWAAPWDRLVFDFSLRIYGRFYPAAIVAAILMIWQAWRRRDLGLWLLLAWAIGVLVPNILATSKTPTATLSGWPPFLILIGALIARAIHPPRSTSVDAQSSIHNPPSTIPFLLAWLTLMLLAIFAPGQIPREGFGYPPGYIFGQIMHQHIWVLWHVLIALGAAGAGIIFFRPPRLDRPLKAACIGLAALAGAASLFLAAQLAWTSWRVTQFNQMQPTFRLIGAEINAGLPDNAVLLLEMNEKLEHIVAMFWIDRTVYPVTPALIEPTADKIRAAGGKPYLLTHRALPLPMVLPGQEGWRLYEVREDRNPMPTPPVIEQ